MQWLEILFLSIVQGLTEFLPVSSSGHLVLAQKILGFEDHSLFIDVAVHVGTLLSVLTVYRKNIGQLIRNVYRPSYWSGGLGNSSIYINVLAATIPTAVFGLMFKDFFTGLFSNILAVSGCFFFTGTVLYLTHFRTSSTTMDDTESHFRFALFAAVLIGVAQTFAIAPGISRSGMTIATGLLLGLTPAQASYFSFLLAIPAILGGAVLTAKDVVWTPEMINSTLMAIGFSYFFGLVGLWSVIRVVKRGNLKYFSYYLWTLSGLVVALSLWG